MSESAVPSSERSWKENIDLRVRALEERLLSLSLLEQRLSKFEQQSFNVEDGQSQSKVEERVVDIDSGRSQAADLTATLENGQSPLSSFIDERVACSVRILTEHFTESLTALSERLQLLEQSVHDSQDHGQGELQSQPTLAKNNFENASDVTSRHMEYVWRSSIWDMAVFIFSGQMNFKESMVVLACLMFTLILLTAFVLEVDLLISSKYQRFDDTSQKEYYFWRSTVGHDLNYRNKFTDVSLASIVCNGRLYAPVSSLQLQTARDLQSYLTETGFFSLPAGAYFAALAVCVWYLALLHEFRTIYELVSASYQLKSGPKTTFEANMDEDETYQIVTISYRRRFLLGILITVRLVIVCILGWQGTLFLLSEADLETMILNSMALQMMLTFDDMLYDLVPSIPQTIVKRMQPLRIVSSRRCRCWHEWGLFVLAVFFTSAIAILVSLLHSNFVQDLRDSYDALCGGGYDFVVAVDAIGIPWAAATKPIEDNVQEAYLEKAMATARTRFRSRPSLSSSQRFNRGFFMQVASSQQLEQAVSSLPEFNDPVEWSMIDPVESVDVVGWENEILVLGQQDFADEPRTVYNHYLQHLLKQTGNVSCAQVPVSRCTQPGRKAEDVVMRKLCPTHCGCASPTAGTVATTYGSSSRSDFTGCAVWNTRRKTFTDALQVPCADTVSRDDFVSWSRGVGNAKHNSSGSMLSEHLVSMFDSGKCPEVVKIRLKGLRICQETSLPSICPESCGCKTSGGEWTSSYTNRYDFCPYTCYSSQPPCMTVAASERSERGPHAGFACIFPFKFQGVTYHSCTSRGHNKPWCAVTLLDGVSSFWGDCPNTSACVNRST